MTEMDRICFSMLDGYIILLQHGPDNFSVRYGLQLDRNLSYERAAAKLGQAIMHDAACESRLDNRSAEEARQEEDSLS